MSTWKLESNYDQVIKRSSLGKRQMAVGSCGSGNDDLDFASRSSMVLQFFKQSAFVPSGPDLETGK
jgi:hypothetical protein